MLLPALASLPAPLALVEVGAAVGLCLLPDRYAYDYGARRLAPEEVVFRCMPHGAVPATGPPRSSGPAGIDLEPSLSPRVGRTHLSASFSTSPCGAAPGARPRARAASPRAHQPGELACTLARPEPAHARRSRSRVQLAPQSIPFASGCVASPRWSRVGVLPLWG